MGRQADGEGKSNKRMHIEESSSETNEDRTQSNRAKTDETEAGKINELYPAEKRNVTTNKEESEDKEGFMVDESSGMEQEQTKPKDQGSGAGGSRSEGREKSLSENLLSQSKMKYHEDDGESKVNVPHLMQEETWDCGLASVKMVLRAAKPNLDPLEFSNSSLLSLVRTRSIWTIDLAYLLAHFKVSFVFYTISTNINRSTYRGIPFYNELDNDEDRVNQYFERAKENGVEVINRSLFEEELRSILLGEVPMLCRDCQLDQQQPCEHRREASTSVLRCAIVLVDINFMRSYAREVPNGGLRNYGRWFLQALQQNVPLSPFPYPRSTYSGHYIVLIGFEKSTQEYTYRDPASSLLTCYIDASILDQARKAVGTDEDIIFVEFDLPQQASSI